jgi:hypothetical protein
MPTHKCNAYRESSCRKLPAGREFPLPIPSSSGKPSIEQHHTQHAAAPGSPLASPGSSCCGGASAGASPTAHSLQAAQSLGVPLSPAASAALKATTFVGASWGRTPIPIAPSIDVQTHVAASAAGGTSNHAQQQLAVPIGCFSPSAAIGTGWSIPHTGISSSTAGVSPHVGGSPCLSPHVTCSPRPADGCQAGRLESPVSSARAFRDTLDQLVQQRQNSKGSSSSASNINDSSSSNLKARSQAAVVREAAQQLAAAGVGTAPGVNGERNGRI